MKLFSNASHIFFQNCHSKQFEAVMQLQMCLLQTVCVCVQILISSSDFWGESIFFGGGWMEGKLFYVDDSITWLNTWTAILFFFFFIIIKAWKWEQNMNNKKPTLSVPWMKQRRIDPELRFLESEDVWGPKSRAQEKSFSFLCFRVEWKWQEGVSFPNRVITWGK